MKCETTCATCVARESCNKVHIPRPYLNREEQELLWTLGAVIATVEETVRQVKRRRNDVENQRLIKCLELIAKLGNRSVDILTGDLSIDKFIEYTKRLGRRELVIKDR